MDFLLIFLSLYAVQTAAVGQACPLPIRLPSFSDPGREAPRIQSNSIQAIITSYQFHCCGVIAGWSAFVEPGGMNHRNGVYSIKFQVWRPSATSGNRYEKVGENDFPLVTLSADSLIRETPASNERLPFQPGDVVGYYLTQLAAGNKGLNGGIQFDEAFSQETMWYVTGNTDLQREDVLEVGINADLQMSTNLGPIISVSFSTDSYCPSTVTSRSHVSSVRETPTPHTPTSTLIPTPSLSSSFSKLISSLLSVGPESSRVQSVDSSTRHCVETSASLCEGTPDQNITDSILDQAMPPSELIIGVAVALILLVISATLLVGFIVLVLKRRKSSRAANVGKLIAQPSTNYKYGIDGNEGSAGNTSNQHLAYNSIGFTPRNHVMGDVLQGASKILQVSDVQSAEETGDSRVYDDITALPTVLEKRELLNNGYEMQEVGPNAGSHVPYSGYEMQEVGPNAGSHVPDSGYEMQEGYSSTGSKALKDYYEVVGGASDGGSHVLYEMQEETPNAGANNYETQEGSSDTALYDKLQFFVEDQIYWAPATTASGLYQQLASKRYQEIPRNQLSCLEQLGSGQFGQVHKGLWTISHNKLLLAVKTLKPNASEDDKIKFLQEAAIMGQFSHSNVVKLYGVVTVGEPVMICLEIMSVGDLVSYLQGIDRSSKSSRGTRNLQLLFLRFAREIAAGMNYLSQKAFVHRDLAARNVLLNETLSCKIGDFGLARDLIGCTYYKSNGGQIPIKWTAPEALLYQKYSADSDVWSYGMVLFEVWSVGKKPFSMYTNNDVLKLVQSGYCQPPPPGCPREIYKLMINCWNPEHQYRPKFDTITSDLQRSPAKLLYWSSLNNKLSQQVSTLGASLEEAYDLHRDIQETYKPNIFLANQ